MATNFLTSSYFLIQGLFLDIFMFFMHYPTYLSLFHCIFYRFHPYFPFILVFLLETRLPFVLHFTLFVTLFHFLLTIVYHFCGILWTNTCQKCRNILLILYNIHLKSLIITYFSSILWRFHWFYHLFSTKLMDNTLLNLVIFVEFQLILWLFSTNFTIL